MITGTPLASAPGHLFSTSSSTGDAMKIEEKVPITTHTIMGKMRANATTVRERRSLVVNCAQDKV